MELTSWAGQRAIRLEYIHKPYIERYNRTVRYDCLVRYLFATIAEVQEFAIRWLCTNNHQRPNMALGGITPL